MAAGLKVSTCAEMLKALIAALHQGGHGEMCLLYDFSRPCDGKRKCDCWMAAAEAAVASVRRDLSE